MAQPWKLLCRAGTTLAAFLGLCLTAQAASVTLAWNPNPEPDLSGYIVYYGTNSRSYSSWTNVGNVTTATIYGLSNAVWYFALTAVNTSGLESDFSDEIVYSAKPSTNTPPMLKPIADIYVPEHQTTNVQFEVWDIETNPANIAFAVASTNQALANIEITGTNHIRFVKVTPLMRYGTTQVRLTASDGTNSSSVTFLVNVLKRPDVPIRFYVRTIYEVGPTAVGPWTNVNATIVPFVLERDLYYRIWR